MAGGAGYRNYTTLLDSLEEYAKEGFGKKPLKLIKWAAVGSTIRLVSNCEDVTDWDIEDSGNFNCVNETSTKLTGSNALELVDVGGTVGTAVTMDDAHRPKNEDWSDFFWLCLWVYDDTGARLTGELTVQVRNNGDWSAELPVPINSNADKWEVKCIYIGGIARGRVDGFRFVNRRGDSASEKVYVDRILVTDLVAGEGNGSVLCSGPVIGPVRPFQVASGKTIIAGAPVNMEEGEADTGAQNDIALIGIACCEEQDTDGVVASDNVPAEVLVACAGAKVWARNDGSGCNAGAGVLLASGNKTVTANATNADHKLNFLKALDAGAANEDSQFSVIEGSILT